MVGQVDSMRVFVAVKTEEEMREVAKGLHVLESKLQMSMKARAQKHRV